MWLLLWKCRISSYPPYCSIPEPVGIDSYSEEAGTAIQCLRKPLFIDLSSCAVQCGTVCEKMKRCTICRTNV